MAGTVRTVRHDRVLEVRIDREAKRNAIDPETTAGIGAALDLLEDDPDLWAGVITGTTTCFSAGTDLRAGMSETERGGRYGVIRRARTKPLIAAVEGPALGGGMEIVLACDLVVASTTARFGLPEVSRGLVPTCAGMFRAPHALPVNVAHELLLTGDPIDAERAERLGFVNRLTAPGEAGAVALALAARIAENGPVAVRETMGVLHDLRAEREDRGFALTDRAEQVIRTADDTREGVAAFFEKRPPRWTGR